MPGNKFVGRDVQRKTVDVMIMRMAEVYLIAAEASVRLNKGDAAKYINVLRTRAGAGTVSESQVDLNYVFDEYARELCGECGRWYLLKRNALLRLVWLLIISVLPSTLRKNSICVLFLRNIWMRSTIRQNSDKTPVINQLINNQA